MRKTVLFGASLLIVCASVLAADEPKKPRQPSAEEQAAMEAMMKAATPGEMHKKLTPMVGVFDLKITMWNMPGQPPTNSTGTSENTWVLGGRFIEQKATGDFMGMPFLGIGYTGYDNIKKIYVGTWMDNFGTQVMISTGTTDDGKTYNFDSSVSDPMTGKTQPVKEKITVVDDDHHVMEMWGPGPDGKMYKMMEITYTRKKS